MALTGARVTVVDKCSGIDGTWGYRPENYEGHYYGRTTLRDSLGNSLNIPAVKVLKYVGVPAFQDMARRLGITTLDDWDRRWFSLTLGGGEVRLLELTGAYATLARGGYHIPVESFLEVRTTRNEVMYEARNRPRWLPIPMSAIHRLAATGEEGAP